VEEPAWDLRPELLGTNLPDGLIKFFERVLNCQVEHLTKTNSGPGCLP